MKYTVENLTNCPNCNAPLQSSVCQYCGTRVGWDEGEVDFSYEQITIPIYISERQFAEACRDLGCSLKGEGDAK